MAKTREETVWTRRSAEPGWLRASWVKGRSLHLIPRARESQGRVLSREAVIFSLLVVGEWTAERKGRLVRRVCQLSRHKAVVAWPWWRWRRHSALKSDFGLDCWGWGLGGL